MRLTALSSLCNREYPDNGQIHINAARFVRVRPLVKVLFS